MDPTTKEGREALRLRIKTAMIALAGLCNGTRPMRMSGPSQSDDPDLQIAGGLAVGKDALSHIEKLEAEIASMRAGLGVSLDVALRERNEFLAERDELRATCARHLRAWETEQAINEAGSRAILAGQKERHALRADLERAREKLWDIAALMRPEWDSTRDTRNPLRTLLAAILVRVSEGGFPSGPITAIPPAAQKFGLTSAEVEEIANMRPPKPVALSPDPAPVDPASQEPYEPSEVIPLGAVLRALYASEINASIEWLWDGGYQVCVGGSPYGGWEAHNSFKEEDFDQIAPWLIKEAGQQFPSSTFTLEYAPALIAAHNARRKP